MIILLYFFLAFIFSQFSFIKKMSQKHTGKSQKSFERDDDTSMNELRAELVKVKGETKALKGKLREAEQHARIAKNEVRNTHTYICYCQNGLTGSSETGRSIVGNLQGKGKK
jgi:hypothetical protein